MLDHLGSISVITDQSGAVVTSNTETIFIPLLDEGTPVLRPTQGVPLGGNRYKVLATSNYGASGEHWKYPPGSVVLGLAEVRNGEKIIVAQALVSD